MRRLELILVSVLALLTLLWVVFPPSGRPQDVDLLVEVKRLPPELDRPERLEATVRWEWKPRLWAPPVRRWQNCIAFSFDWAEWTPLSNGAGISEIKGLQAAFGEPSSGHCMLIPDAPSGEYRMGFARRAKSTAVAVPAVFPLGVQFVRISGFGNQPQFGWIRSIADDWAVQ